MKLVRVKTEKELGDFGALGVTVHFRQEDGNIKEVFLRDLTGKEVFIKYEQYGSMQVLIPEPPKTEPRFVVTGTVLGNAVEPKFFEDKYSADRFIDDMASRVYRNEDAQLIIEEKLCIIDDAGNVTRVA